LTTLIFRLWWKAPLATVIADQKRFQPYVVRKANEKSVREIHNEI